MGQPPEKSSSPLSFCNSKALLVASLALCFAVIITFLLTWQITKAAFGPDPKSWGSKNTADSKDTISAADLRLPTSVKPISYELTLKTYLPGYGYKDKGEGNNRNLTFDGQVTILLNISQSVKKISLNSLDLKFIASKCSVTVGDETIKISSIEPMPKFEKVFVNLEKSLDSNTLATLKLVYEGPLRTDMSGLYQTTYTNNKGEQKMAAVTQLEPVYARRMVPCFDEPDFKATWTVTVIHPKGTVAIANGIENGEPSEITEDFMSSSFKTTPKMSTYLLAVFVSEFEFNEKKTKSGVRFRVWSRPEEKETTKYAVEAGVKCLEYYEEIYGIKFPLEKQDMVALPDFSAGAMENWGLITYRESDLLYDQKIYTGSQKRRVALVIAHELAHQWFGNLVTMKWWNDLWLNEGFATLIEYMGTDKISDDHFRMKDFFVVDALSAALEEDSVASTHPMTFRIDKAEEVLDSFDGITYQKGGSVLAMIRKTLGEENFMAGVHHYLTKHQFDNAVAEDLFSALNEKLPETVLGSDGKKLNVSVFADPWTKQLGYPLLTVTKINSTFVKVSQQRFKLLPDAEEQEKYSNPKWKFKWDVPIWYEEGESKKEKMIWMTPNEPLEIEMPDDKTLVLNSDSDGFYRVNYDEDLWLNIIKKLKISSEAYSPRTKVRLIEDAFTAASAGHLNYSIPIDLIGYLKNEKEYIPWCSAIQAIKEIISYYGTDPEKEPIENFVKGLIAKSPAKHPTSFVAENYLKDEKFNEVAAASLLTSTECSLKDTTCIGDMTKLFKDNIIAKCSSTQMVSECSHIPAPFRASSYCYGVKNGDDEIFGKIFDWFKKERNQVEKENLQNALACSRDVTTLKKLMLDAMKSNGSAFRLQDVSSLFVNIARNDVAKDFLLNFLITRWDELLVRLADDRSGFIQVINCLTRGINSQEGLEQLKAFRTNTKTAQTYDFKIMEESIGVKIAWREKHLNKVSKLFKEAAKNV